MRAAVTLRLSVVDEHVTGISVPLLAARVQVLVATVIPLRATRMLPLARSGCEVPKVKVQ